MNVVEFDLRPSTAEGRTLLWILVDGRRAAFTTMRNDDAQTLLDSLLESDYEVSGV